MKNNTITLHNSFHATQVSIRRRSWMPDVAPEGTAQRTQDELNVFFSAKYRGGEDDASAKRLAGRIRRTLCGISGCTCGVVR